MQSRLVWDITNRWYPTYFIEYELTEVNRGGYNIRDTNYVWKTTLHIIQIQMLNLTIVLISM